MPTINPHRRRRSHLALLAMTFATFIMLGGGLVLALWVIGVPLTFWRQDQPTANPYLVRIPVNVRPIAAYSKVDRTDLLDPKTGWLKFQELPPQSAIGMSISGVSLQGAAADGKVADMQRHEGQLLFVLDSGEKIPHNRIDVLGGALMNVSAIIGRVLRKDKTTGLGFREDNFFPRGTPEGIAGATPPGMRAIILSAGTLKGIHTLPAGARVDLMANIPLDDLSSFDRGHNSRLPGAALVLSSGNKQSRGGRTEPIMLAQEALVLKPVYQRVEATTSSSLTQGRRVQAVPVYEVALAVHPGDVIPLQSALNKELEVICIAHSMQPTDKPDALTATRANGLVAPVTSRSILAYEVLTYDYFEDAATRRIRHEPVSAEEVESLGVVTSLEQLVGTVVKHDIPKGSFITQADLLQTPKINARPTGEPDLKRPADVSNARGEFRFAVNRQATADSPQANQREASQDDRREPRPNIVGEVPTISRFVPPGHKAVAIPWNRLYGAEHLQIGDIVDLTVSYSLQYKTESKEQERKPDGTVIERTIKRLASEPTERTYDETLGFRGEPWFAALDAKVIGPVGYPPPAAATRFLGESLFKPSNSSSTDSHSGPPILLAISERDQEAVSAALATEDATFSIIIHSPISKTNLPAGWKRVVLAPEGISAFERLTSTDLEQRHTRRLLTRLVRDDDPMYDKALTESELRPLLGRVLRSYKRRHAFFSVDDFFPPGVQPGFAADIGIGSAVYVADDRDIDGLEHFRDNDRIAILFRAVLKRPEGVIAHGVDLERPIATVVVPVARIIRASQEGKTVLEIDNDDLARLQAAWAKAFTKRDGESDEQDKNRRLHLVAVSISTSTRDHFAEAVMRPSTAVKKAPSLSADIPDFDPIANVRVLEAIIGDQRKTHIFAGDNRRTNQSTIPFHTAGQ